MAPKLNNSSYHQLSWNDCLENESDFEELINWLSSEFILYQQENNQGIKVCFPNGWFVISIIKERSSSFDVFLCSKSNFTFIEIKEQLLLAIHRFKNLKKSYSHE